MDASLHRGAICEVEAPRWAAEALWGSGEKQGGYSRLGVPARALRRAAGLLGVDDQADCLDPGDDFALGLEQRE
eukprot:8400531-Lingulodinium_polyedra.AAC.1